MPQELKFKVDINFKMEYDEDGQCLKCLRREHTRQEHTKLQRQKTALIYYYNKTENTIVKRRGSYKRKSVETC